MDSGCWTVVGLPEVTVTEAVAVDVVVMMEVVVRVVVTFALQAVAVMVPVTVETTRGQLAWRGSLGANTAWKWDGIGRTCRCHFGRWGGCGHGVCFAGSDGVETIYVHQETACDGGRIVGFGGSRRRWIVAWKVRMSETMCQIASSLVIWAVGLEYLSGRSRHRGGAARDLHYHLLSIRSFGVDAEYSFQMYVGFLPNFSARTISEEGSPLTVTLTTGGTVIVTEAVTVV